jgi:hypothetical protein
MIEKLDEKWRDLSSHYSQSQHANILLQLNSKVLWTVRRGITGVLRCRSHDITTLHHPATLTPLSTGRWHGIAGIRKCRCRVFGLSARKV